MKNFNVRMIDDYEWIIKQMDKYGSKTKTSDDQTFMNMEKACYGFYLGDEIKAFATILTYKGIDIVGYTWDDGSFTGKKVYALGADYIDKKYKYLKLGSAERYNKALRRNL